MGVSQSREVSLKIGTGVVGQELRVKSFSNESPQTSEQIHSIQSGQRVYFTLGSIARCRTGGFPFLGYNLTMQDSVFTKIVKGEIPSHKIYEDDQTLVFLDIHPVQPGHTLVIPKKQVEFVWDLDDQTYLAVMNTTKKVALRLRQVMEAPYVSERIVGVDVPHAHVQLIPFSNVSELRVQVDLQAEPDHQALATMAQKLQFSDD